MQESVMVQQTPHPYSFGIVTYLNVVLKPELLLV
jgi:hypothetical protein